MRKIFPVLLKTLVKPFYRRYAGPLLLIFILFFGAVGELSGDRPSYTGPLPQWHYQYALILGILSTPVFFGLTLLLWLIYAQKCAGFVLAVLDRPEHGFLQLLDRLDPKSSYGYFLLVQFLLFLPVSLYAAAITGVALYKGWYGAAVLVPGIVVLLAAAVAARFQRRLRIRRGRYGLAPELRPVPLPLALQKTRRLLHRSFVRPYYRENAGLFLFLFILLFGVVAPSQQLNYHYHLILGMLSTPVLFGLVSLAWWLYAEKTVHFILTRLRAPDHSFVYLLNLLSPAKTYGLLLRIQAWLYLPVSLYGVAVMGVAVHRGSSLQAAGVGLYLLLLQFLGAARMLRQLQHPPSGTSSRILSLAGRLPPARFRPYWHFLLRSVLREHKALLLGIKLFNGAMLYLLLKAVSPDDYDLRMPLLFYSIGLFGHGVLIYRLRELEELRLVFYRGLPVPLLRRMGQYLLLCLLLLVPELILVSWLSPAPLHYRDAVGFFLWGYALLLLMNSLLFMRAFPMKDYLKLLFFIFLVLYACVLAGALPWLTGLTFVAAAGLFYGSYYRYERPV